MKIKVVEMSALLVSALKKNKYFTQTIYNGPSGHVEVQAIASDNYTSSFVWGEGHEAKIGGWNSFLSCS